MIKQREKSAKKIPYQIKWDTLLRDQFDALMHLYDPDLSMNQAILKLIRWAIEEEWIPGYIRKNQGKVISNQNAKDLDSLNKAIDNGR